MAGIIRTVYGSGATLYAHVRQGTDGQVWNGSAFESYNSANWGNYDIALTEDASSGYYKATFPATISSGMYDIYVYEQSGGSPATSDASGGPVGTGVFRWDGSAELTLVTVTVGSISSNAITAASIATGAVDADALATDAVSEIADGLLDRTSGIESSYTLRQALRLILSACAAKLSGAATASVVIRDVGDTKNRISATVDASGNRTAVTLDAS